MSPKKITKGAQKRGTNFLGGDINDFQLFQKKINIAREMSRLGFKVKLVKRYSGNWIGDYSFIFSPVEEVTNASR